jgi:bacteriocin biosynthesis cyclodehydratase domain-containing protein
MKDLQTRKPQLSLPYTVLTERGTVRLVAGEDFRYTLTGPGIEDWLPGLLAGLDGRQSLEQALRTLSATFRESALKLIERLYGERILTDATATAAPSALPYRLEVIGTGRLVESLEPRGTLSPKETSMPALAVLCQDRLDYEAALQFNRRCRAGTAPWLWASYGPMSRAYVSPVFWPDAGPCLACLVRHFQRLSPAPEIYVGLIDHARRERPIEPVPFPPEAINIVAGLVRWKAALLGQREPAAAVYRLHVLETDTLEVTSHRVFADPECPDCGEGG